MTLLRQIQEAAADGAVRVSEVLRKSKILATRLKSEEFSTWIERELNGYPEGEQLPEYRILRRVESRGHFVGIAGSALKNGIIPVSSLPERFHDFAAEEQFRSGVSVYEELLAAEGGGSFKTNWPADLVAAVGRNIYDDLNCLAAWKEIPRGAIVRVVDSVRNKLLTFALEIESNNPNAGEAAPNETPVPDSVVSHVFHNAFYGNVGNVAVGSSDVNQAASVVTIGDMSALRAELKKLGVGADDVAELEAAMEADRSEAGKPSIGRRVAQWLGNGLAKAASGAWNVSLQTASSVLPHLISQYLGLPSG